MYILFIMSVITVKLILLTFPSKNTAVCYIRKVLWLQMYPQVALGHREKKADMTAFYFYCTLCLAVLKIYICYSKASAVF